VTDDVLWQLHSVSLEPARLRHVSLTIWRGITAVVGWSGAGKTSLLNLLTRFERPDSGHIAGTRNVFWVPQNGGLWPLCTVRRHLEIVSERSDDIDARLAVFDLAQRAGARPDELSEGEQSRLAVARALASSAAVLVMDEPLVHVDPARAGKYWGAIRQHLAATRASLVFSTHVPETALAEADRAICLGAGNVSHEGPVTELYHDPPDQELMHFLGPGNWLTPEQARVWLGIETRNARCFRPEQLSIEANPGAQFVVESARFMGSLA
jgi:iron(III) transport system ATP-binding protein